MGAYNKKIFFFITKDIERNISTTALDFYDYCLLKIAFEDEKKNEIEQQIKNLYKDYDNISHKAEIEYRLNLYKDKIEEYSNISDDQKSKNYFLMAARDLSYFAGLYGKIGNFEKKLELEQKTLKIRKKVLGNEHPDVATSYNNIGCVYSEQGDYSKALDFYQKALKIREKVMGDNHPKTVIVRDNIEIVNNKMTV
jgi:tetratricopeptide (TPR) repeat protein